MENTLLVAGVGAGGVIIGALITSASVILKYFLETQQRKKLDKKRKKLLIKMLDSERFPNKWRKLKTLSRVIGTDEETTKRLLIEIGARGSETESDSWGLIKHHPLEDITNT